MKAFRFAVVIAALFAVVTFLGCSKPASRPQADADDKPDWSEFRDVGVIDFAQSPTNYFGLGKGKSCLIISTAPPKFGFVDATVIFIMANRDADAPSWTNKPINVSYPHGTPVKVANQSKDKSDFVGVIFTPK